MGRKFLAMCTNKQDICDYIGTTEKHTLSQIYMFVNRSRSSISSRRPLGRVLRLWYAEAKNIINFKTYKKTEPSHVKNLVVMMYPAMNYFGCATSE